MKEDRAAIAPIEQFRKLSTCIVASAIESFSVRLPNKGFTNYRVNCIFKDFPPVVGYAATARLRTVDPPMEGGHYRYERSDWWGHIQSIPAPRIVVIEDIDSPPGLGALVGEVNAHILMSLGCCALVTNGAVRDIAEIRSTGFQLFARNAAVSHAYAHIVDFGGPVVVGGLDIHPGDLVHGDANGVQTIPAQIADRVPAVAHRMLQRREEIIRACRADTFSMEELRRAVKEPDVKE